MGTKWESRIALLIALAGLILFGIMTIRGEGLFGGADNLSHYKFARYAFQHPEFYFNHWAKPVYTLLSSPFAQLGLKGMAAFNVITGSLTAYFTYKVATCLGYKNAYLAVLLVLFAPIYSVLLPTALTEILFSFILVLSIFLFLKRQYIWSAVILSFLPFVRTEGVVIFAVFGLAYIYRQHYKAIPFLLLGFVLYSIAGYFYFDDIFWVINKMPYSGAKDIYGEGRLFHFVVNGKKIFGIFLSILLITGILVLVFRSVKASENREKIRDEWLLIAGSLFIYFAAHSFVWWQGLGGSLGLLRVMGGIIPLAALLGLKGFNLILWPLRSYNWAKYAVIIIFSFFYVKHAFEVYKMPVPLHATEKLTKETSEWLKKTDHYNEKIYFYNPWCFYFLDKNPFDLEQMEEGIPNRQDPADNVPPGSIIIWDAHFGPNEGRMPLDRLMKNDNYELIKVFRPENSFTVLGGNTYEIYVFKRTKSDNNNTTAD